MHFLRSARSPHVSFSAKSTGWVIILVVLLFMGLTTIISSPVYAVSTSTNAQITYVDKTLGFNLQLPKGWEAAPHTSIHNTNNADVIFTDPKMPGTNLEINVMRSSSATTDFARQGKPTLHIGGYPAFNLDTHAGQQVLIPCLVRVMLVHSDVVTASWCAKDAPKYKQTFESILASYHDQSAASLKSSMVVQGQSMAHSPLTCQQVFSSGSDNPPSTYPNNEWGTQKVNPTDSTWTSSFGQGVAVCDNYYSTANGGYEYEKGYLFQCVELASRFVYEEWNLPAFNVDAYQYFDYYQGGTKHSGVARNSAYQAQLIDDASQGNNSTAPVPGDLLVFQDVNDGEHWTSGEIYDSGGYYKPGHVVVVTNVTSNTVNVVQENWQNGEIHSFSLQHLSNGYHVVDNSSWTGRITRGWIHFSANGGSSGTGSSGSGTAQSQAFTSVGANPDGRLEVFERGTDNNIYHMWEGVPGNNWQTAWAELPTTIQFAGDPVVAPNWDGHLEVFARGTDNNIYHIWQTSPGGHWQTAWVEFPTTIQFAGGPVMGANWDGHLEAFALGTDNNIYHIWQISPGGDWESDWVMFPTGSFQQ